MTQASAGRHWPNGAAAAALALVLVEALLAHVGVHVAPLSAVVLVGAPGLAVKPFLPRQLGVVGRWAAVPVTGCALVSILVITISTLGISLTGTSVRLGLGAVALVGVVAATRWRPD